MARERAPLRSFDPSYGLKALILLAIGCGLVSLDRNVIAPLLPVMVEDLGTITGMLAVFWVPFSVIAGGFSDRVGRRRMTVPTDLRRFGLASVHNDIVVERRDRARCTPIRALGNRGKEQVDDDTRRGS